jgi:hypothetical protein
MNVIKINRKALSDARKEVGLKEMQRKLSICPCLVARLQDKIIVYR